MHFDKDVEKLITAAEDLSLGPEENEFALSVDHLSQAAAGADDHEESQTSIGKGEGPENVDEEHLMEMTATHNTTGLPTVATSDFSTTEYLPFMLHVHSPSGILPRYPSWSLVCLGSSSLYSHNSGSFILRFQLFFVFFSLFLSLFSLKWEGLSDQPGFLTGSGFLLPWDIPVRLPNKELSLQEGKRAHAG